MDDNHHEQVFKKFCSETFLNSDSKGQGSKTIGRRKGNKIVKLLKNDDAEQFNDFPKFKHWVKTRVFQLITYTALGLCDVLCLTVKSKVRFM